MSIFVSEAFFNALRAKANYVGGDQQPWIMLGYYNPDRYRMINLNFKCTQKCRHVDESYELTQSLDVFESKTRFDVNEKDAFYGLEIVYDLFPELAEKEEIVDEPSDSE